MYRIYRPNDSDTTYGIRLESDGATIFDHGTKQSTLIEGDFETIHQALGTYLLRQFKVDAAYGELTMGLFDSP